MFSEQNGTKLKNKNKNPQIFENYTVHLSNPRV